jgi:type II secretory pathway predicted ATPase ExeA
MYTSFYNLKEKPFELTPSPRFLYLGESHKEALALLTYGIIDRKGFILLTGEVGTGKTTMVQALLANLGPDVQYVYLSNPLFSQKDFINYLAFTAFKRNSSFKSKAEFLIEFEAFLKERLKLRKNFLLIIDEAQMLSFELLEEIRLLSNMETADKKLINIFLVGQPELNENLSQPRCRALMQRISTRYHIRPLDLEGTQEYIATRLKIAGAEDVHKIFPKDVIRSIQHFSQGFPRMINILADNVLLLGYSSGKRKITPVMVKECYQDLQPQGGLLEKSQEAGECAEVRRAGTASLGRYWKWIAVLLIVLAAVFVITRNGHDVTDRLSSFILDRFHGSAQKAIPRPGISVDAAPTGKGQGKAQDVLEVIVKTGVEVREKPEGEMGKQEETANREGDSRVFTKPVDDAPEEVEALATEEKEGFWKSIVIQEGDTLTELATEVYGWVDQRVFDLLKKNNPDISDINLIHVGQKIVFPPLPKSEREPTYTVHVASFKPFGYAQQMFQRLMKQGYEVYILPVNSPRKGKIFRVTLGNFNDPHEAQVYASKIKEMGVSDYARMIQVEMK